MAQDINRLKVVLAEKERTNKWLSAGKCTQNALTDKGFGGKIAHFKQN